MMDAISTETCW